jgi:hypothetical protein
LRPGERTIAERGISLETKKSFLFGNKDILHNSFTKVKRLFHLSDKKSPDGGRGKGLE